MSQLLILAMPVYKVNQKSRFYRGRQTYCLFLCYIVQFWKYWFSGQTVSVNLRDLCQILLQ